jgi:hypothetical protein
MNLLPGRIVSGIPSAWPEGRVGSLRQAPPACEPGFARNPTLHSRSEPSFNGEPVRHGGRIISMVRSPGACSRADDVPVAWNRRDR